MSTEQKKVTLSDEEKKRLLVAMRTQNPMPSRQRVEGANVPEKYTKFEELAGYKQLVVQNSVAAETGLINPFFTCHDGMAKATTWIDGKQYINFSTYDYLDLNGHPQVNAAAIEAMQRYGTSAGASRPVSGERPPHAKLEHDLAELFNRPACVAFVSGHATNVTTLGHLFSPHDAIYHDSLSHNSLIQGARLSGAARFSFPHNDMEALEKLLSSTRGNHQRAVIVSEGLFSMDGHLAKLDELVDLKKRFKCFLMVDEAHSVGTLGATGRGITEHAGIPAAEIDLLMGTLSKTFCGCGGFIVGNEAVVEYLKYTGPGFLYSVGMSPPLAAASAKALELMLREPARVTKVQENSQYFLAEAAKLGLDTGNAHGTAIVPLIVGSSLVTGFLSRMLFEHGVNVQPIIYPVVEEGLARLRFFISAAHEKEHLQKALELTATLLPEAEKKAKAFTE